jgi:hypothetical protein
MRREGLVGREVMYLARYVKVQLQHLQGFTKVLAAEGRVDQQPVVARINPLRGQV